MRRIYLCHFDEKQKKIYIYENRRGYKFVEEFY